MKHLKSGLFAAALVLGLFSAPAFAQNSAAGDWDLSLETPQGANTVTLTLALNGDKATGSMTSQMGSMPMTGTATADGIALKGNLEIQGMSLELGLNGKVVGDAFNGTMKMGDFGEFPFTGKRSASAAKATAAPAASAAPSAAPAATNAGGVAGKWNVTLSIAGAGDFPMTADLKQDGPNVTGMLNSAVGEVPVKGTLTGSSLKLEFTAETPQGAMSITMNGELSAAGLTGKAAIAGLGEADWKAVR